MPSNKCPTRMAIARAVHFECPLFDPSPPTHRPSHAHTLHAGRICSRAQAALTACPHLWAGVRSIAADTPNSENWPQRLAATHPLRHKALRPGINLTHESNFSVPIPQSYTQNDEKVRPQAVISRRTSVDHHRLIESRVMYLPILD